MTVRVAILGASGYAGGELLRLLLAHPEAQAVSVVSRTNAGKAVARGPPAPLAPDGPGLRGTSFRADGFDVVFLAGAHGFALGGRAAASGPRGLDRGPLGGLPPLRRAGVLRASTAIRPRASRRQREFVYGLPELFREQIRGAKAVASPGCFATASILRARAALEGGPRREGRAAGGLRGDRLLGRRDLSFADDAPPEARRPRSSPTRSTATGTCPRSSRRSPLSARRRRAGSSSRRTPRRSCAGSSRRPRCRSRKAHGHRRPARTSTRRPTATEFFVRLVEGSPDVAAVTRHELRRRRRGRGRRATRRSSSRSTTSSRARRARRSRP